eukprot:TRINITY_DN112226_c0_g1_i1.p1 TRINITY_DN112226_c0_g1~~TRINITY_DN112226_c0_g1_i1.p1  ORF type:complete len:344 (-),score=47.06 TRINITY_DN112226_c0_g1_i1:86-1117(-)
MALMHLPTAATLSSRSGIVSASTGVWIPALVAESAALPPSIRQAASSRSSCGDRHDRSSKTAAALCGSVAFVAAGLSRRVKRSSIRLRSEPSDEELERRRIQGLLDGTDDGRSTAERSPLRCADAIVNQLLHVFKPASGDVLEIAAGSGAHLSLFCKAFPRVHWHPTDANSDLLPQMEAAARFLPNVEPAEVVDASKPWEEWPASITSNREQFSMIYCANLLHCSPWEVTSGLLAGANQALKPGGQLIIFGPFKIGGTFTSEANEDLDELLRISDPAWGLRDADIVGPPEENMEVEGARHGLALVNRIDMPDDNFLLIFRKVGDKAKKPKKPKVPPKTPAASG